MALTVVNDPNSLSQGAETVVTDWVVGTPTGFNVTHTSAGANFPVIIAGEFFEIRDHSDGVNNGLYIATGTPSASSLPSTKVSGSAPIAAGTESASVFASIRNAETVAFANQSGRLVDMTGTGLPSLSVGSRFTIEDHSDADNNGTYQVTIVNTDTSDYTCTKLDLSTADPNDGASEALTMITDVKSVMYDTAGLGIYLLEAPAAIAGMDLDGVLGQAFYSFTVLSWKDDAFLIANAPFPMLTVDADAGKYVIGQDPSGFNSGWVFVDNGTHSIRTHKMTRNMGWSEISAAGVLNAQYAGVRTLGAMLDQTAGTGDLAYYQFGNDTTVNDGVDFTFNGPVNESVQVYNSLATPADAATLGFVITTTDTITRNDGGNWRTDGYKVGSQIVIFDAEDPANDGTYTLLTVADGIDGAITVSPALTNNADDTTIRFGYDHRNSITLRLRERTTPGNSNARTFAQANLASGGETILSNRLFTFPLANSQDLDITASDATISGSGPYTGMSITYYATPQSLGGSNLLVGGPFDFGIVIVANDGTNTQVYEFVEYSLRQTTDIDADADTAIGTMMDGLMRFLGPTLQVGSVDGGLSFPSNPDGGGSGVMITGLNSASKNNTTYYDNLGTVRSHPLGVAVTLDFNQTALDDALLAYSLFFDRTRTRTPGDLIVTAVSGVTGTFDSAGAGLSALNVGAGQYVRVTGYTGVDAAMNGIYQVTTETSTSQWSVTKSNGDTVVTTSSSAAAEVDEYPIDSPDAIIVNSDVPAAVTGTNPSVDVVFTFDYSGNTQGGRSVSTDAEVRFRAIGRSGAQYGQTAVLTIGNAAVTLPLTNNIERNFQLDP